MIDKIVIHLKNVIFFKATIYITLTIILFILLPQYIEDFYANLDRKDRSEAALQAATLKSESLADFESKILEANDRYKKLINNPDPQLCIEITNLINYMNLLSQKHDLFEPIKINVTRNFENNNDVRDINGHIRVYYYNIDITLNAPDYSVLLAIIREIGLFLPAGALIESTKIQKIDILTPNFINKLNTKKSPDLIAAQIHIQLKKIAYEK
jgi:hypothetical protein